MDAPSASQYFSICVFIQQILFSASYMLGTVNKDEGAYMLFFLTEFAIS